MERRPGAGASPAAYSGGGTRSDVFGTASDIPVEGDYDGDGRNDFALFHPSNGQWFAVLTGGGALNTLFGQNGDVPVPADYDAERWAVDGRVCPTFGQFFGLKSGGGVLNTYVGNGGDVPLQKRPSYPGQYPYGPGARPTVDVPPSATRQTGPSPQPSPAAPR